MNEMYGFVYITTNTKTGQKYIGMKKYTKNWETYLGSSKLLKEDINKYGFNQFTREIIEECSSLKQLQEREIFYLNKFDILNNPVVFYNRSIPHIDFRLKRYTNSNKGKTWDEIYGVEVANKKREQLSLRLKNKTWEQVYGIEKTQDLKRKFSYPKTEETRKKMSVSKKGIKFSDSHREKLRQARLEYIKKQKDISKNH
jgi:hypothetical protein